MTLHYLATQKQHNLLILFDEAVAFEEAGGMPSFGEFGVF